MSNTRRISRLARILRTTVLLMLYALPLFVIVPLLTYPDLSVPIREEYSDYNLPHAFATWQIAAYIAVFSVGLAILAIPLWHLHRLLARYALGETLSPACAQALRRIGQGLLAVAAFSFVSNTIDILILTALNASGERTLSIGIEDSDLALVLAGTVVILVGWVMGQAAEMADENRSFI
ncbi:DUF2975 domain-containing protein [Actibacterium sp. 188UL27-1]|uniref:DUF2975 domain-containing protein n=1 Tax=Actibacterium sp. 188UL27-1 TaxID=2786961 RepID=UPI00195A88A9|nr:DUF2975 domain-containing protein [Actibacterium sp. 188UL27-1]MBM7067072.1 DUF2975 domain-containing protein [Actibacterium sp. 188UL27-1]